MIESDNFTLGKDSNGVNIEEEIVENKGDGNMANTADNTIIKMIFAALVLSAGSIACIGIRKKSIK